jgi:hypothetical protein
VITRLRRAGLATLAAVLVMLGAPIGPASAQSAGRVRIDLDQLAPRVVDATTQTVTVSGKITNTGDRRVDRIAVRLQRGEPLENESQLRGALDQPQQTGAVTRPTVSSTFQDVATSTLQAGETSQFELTVSLGADRNALKIDKPGIYPLVLNVNGVPDFGSTERIGAVSMLLPVLAVPGGAAVPPPADPSRIGMLWPLVDEQPRMVETPIGGGKLIFADDALGESLTGGRLFALLNAVQSAATADNTVLRSLCFAIDADLIATVAAMTNGYQVHAGDGRLVDGKSRDAARLWLSAVQELTRGQCVIALPLADADLAALSRSGSVELRAAAIAEATATIETTLGVKPLPGVVWPDGGTLDQRTLTDLSSGRRTTVLADAGRLQQVTGVTPFTLGPVTRAIPYDPLVASSLTPRTAVESGIRTSTLQNGLATLVFRGAFHPVPGQTVLIAPPRRWSASLADLRVFLQTFQTLQSAGYARPLNLPTLVDGADQGAAGALDYSARDSAAEIPAPITAEIGRLDAVRRELIANVFAKDDTVLLDPAELLAPVQRGLIRASSTAWRAQPERASTAVREVSGQLDSMLSQVTVTNPGIPLSLASSESPIPVYTTNGLPVTVLAKVNISQLPGLRPVRTTYVQVPANRAIIQYQPVDVSRAGLFTVDVWLTTKSGTPLGDTSQVKLNSTSYGSITVAVTGTAAGALVLLVALRLIRRLRARRAVAAENDL